MITLTINKKIDITFLGVIIYEISRREITDFKSNFIYNFNAGGQNFVSLFCGTCSIESKVAPHFANIICNDKHKYLIAMLNAVQSGYELPDNVSEEQYQYIRLHKDEDMALSGFVGIAGSFGGKWFGGYARNNCGRNYISEGKRSLLRDMETLNDKNKVQFTCLDYRDVPIITGSVVYADPPYANTTQYNGEKFDSEAFWKYMREISRDNLVFISEQNAPDDFKCVWEKPIKRTLDRNKNNQFVVTEKLFVHNSLSDKLSN